MVSITLTELSYWLLNNYNSYLLSILMQLPLLIGLVVIGS